MEMRSKNEHGKNAVREKLILISTFEDKITSPLTTICNIGIFSIMLHPLLSSKSSYPVNCFAFFSALRIKLNSLVDNDDTQPLLIYFYISMRYSREPFYNIRDNTGGNVDDGMSS